MKQLKKIYLYLKTKLLIRSNKQFDLLIHILLNNGYNAFKLYFVKDFKLGIYIYKIIFTAHSTSKNDGFPIIVKMESANESELNLKFKYREEILKSLIEMYKLSLSTEIENRTVDKYVNNDI